MTEKDFAALAERHRRELHVHCYRMLASFDEAEDAVQETFLQRHLPSRRMEWSASEPTAQERELLDRFIDAHERCDAVAAVAIASRDLRITMPPNPFVFEGLEMIAPLLERALGEERDGDWRLLPTVANRMPTAASYLRRPGDSAFRAFKLDVLRVKEGAIAEITTFGPALFPAFGLPPTL